jgi:syndecan 4
LFLLGLGLLECLIPVSLRMGLQGMLGFPLVLLLGPVLLVASAPATPEPHGCSNKEQQVTVSHTYKIDVPKSALVQVEADPQSLSDDGTSLLALGEAGEEQNFIFRHNIRLQTPQDCDLADSVRDLLARVKKLEEEMEEMKEQCSAQRCCQGAAGEFTTWYSFNKYLIRLTMCWMLQQLHDHCHSG